VAGEVILGGVIDLDVGQQRGVLAVVATHITATHLRDAEHQ
jgi:predicted ABC-type sugar transport system permease subunit